MNLGTMRTELLARGYDYLSSTRANQFLNDGYHAVCEWDGIAWPFLETTQTGTAPMTISDLREILFVVNTTNIDRLEQADSRDIVDRDPLMTTTGTPQRYWLDGQSTLNVWPVSTSVQLSVRYLKVPTDLSADTDTPVVPTRYHSVILDMAEVLAIEDDANYQDAEARRQQLALRVARMRDALVVRNDDDPDYIVVTRNDDQGGYWCP